MTGIHVHGLLGDIVWIDRDGYALPLTESDRDEIEWRVDEATAHMRESAEYLGHKWTLFDVLFLSLMIPTAPELDPCTRCRTLPILHGGDHCIECAGLVQEQSDATMRTWRAS